MAATKTTRKNAKEEIKETIEKVETSATETVKKATATAKKSVKTAAETAAAATKTVEETAKKTVKAAAGPEIFIQFAGKETALADLIEKAKEAYKAENKGAVRGMKLYVKPEDGACYYVVGDVTGKVEF